MTFIATATAIIHKAAVVKKSIEITDFRNKKFLFSFTLRENNPWKIKTWTWVIFTDWISAYHELISWKMLYSLANQTKEFAELTPFRQFQHIDFNVFVIEAVLFPASGNRYYETKNKAIWYLHQKTYQDFPHKFSTT